MTVAGPGWQAALAEPLCDLGLDRVAPNRALTPGSLPSVVGSLDPLPSTLPVLECAIASVSAALLAAARLQSVRFGGPAPSVEVDADHVAAAVRSEIAVTVGGRPMASGFGPLSRFWQTRDGFIRTHANYPWHRAALLRALALPDDESIGPAGDGSGLAAALAELSAFEAEARIVGAGGVAAAVRTSDDWRATAQGRAAGVRPLVDLEAVGDAPRRSGPESTAVDVSKELLPASGLRVLDLTRVIAGPVATRMLGALGADVLRVDPPDRPELDFHRVDGLLGKRSALLDADTDAGRRTLDELIGQADVVVCGYRPTSLDRLGLHPQALAYRHPGVVFASVSAWGTTGPWNTRRGFDSLVQAAAGIALAESADGMTPGALPCQLLDHASGYLLAAGILEALARQYLDGGTIGVWVSLARTASWLLGQQGATQTAATPPGRRGDAVPWLVDLPDGIKVVAPPGRLDGVALAWPSLPGGATRYGRDRAAFASDVS